MTDSTENSPLKHKFVVGLAPFERVLLSRVRSIFDSDAAKILESSTSLEHLDADGFNLDDELLPIIEGIIPATTTSDEIVGLAAGITSSRPLPSPFKYWRWSTAVSSDINEFHTAENLADLDNDLTAAYEDALSALCNFSGPVQELFRVETLKKDNEGFLDAFKRQPLSEIEFLPIEDDSAHWKTLDILQNLPLITDLLKFDLGTHAGSTVRFDIWKVVRQYNLARRRAENVLKISSQLLESSIFLSHYSVTPHIDPFTSLLQLQIVDHRGIDALRREEKGVVDLDELGREGDFNEESEEYCELTEQELQEWREIPVDLGSDSDEASFIEEKSDAAGGLTEEEQAQAWRRIFQLEELYSPLDDPRGFLELIPWDTLVEIDIQTLRKQGIDASVLEETAMSDHYEGVECVMWFKWQLTSDAEWHEHLLHTEDEVFQYCILHDFPLPGYLLNKSHVIFSATSLEVTGFISGMRDFWEKWNDCALTLNPSNGRLYLLETIPGRQYRQRCRTQSDPAGRLYFRNVTEDHIQATTKETDLVELLGEGYQAKYQNILRYISPRSITNIESTPMGEGANGYVYGAILQPREVHFCTLRKTEQEPLPIVLKQIKFQFGDESRRKMLRELDMTFTALGGLRSVCVNFIGVTGLFLSEAGTISKPHDNKPKTLFLVFQRCTEGSMFNLLEKQLKDLGWTESWTVVIDSLSNISAGVLSLHRNGVIHGDLHPNNILGSVKYYPNEKRSEYSYLVSDLGEGKHLSHARDTNRSLSTSTGSYIARYKIGDFVAPWLAKTNKLSEKVDIYSFGRIADVVVHVQLHAVRSHNMENTEAEVQRVPLELKGLIERCLSNDPDLIPAMNEVYKVLDGLSRKCHNGTEIRWCSVEESIESDNDSFKFSSISSS